MSLLTVFEIGMKLVDAFQNDDMELNYISGKQSNNIQKEPYRCRCPFPVIPPVGITPMEIQQQQKAICKKMHTAVSSIKAPN